MCGGAVTAGRRITERQAVDALLEAIDEHRKDYVAVRGPRILSSAERDLYAIAERVRGERDA